MSLKQTVRYPSPLQLILILALLQLLITLLTNGFALSQDEAMWHYIGRNWFRHGLVPYSGGVDNKSPLFFAVFGLSDLLFGVNYWFPRVLGTLCQSVGIYYLYKIARQVAGPQAGLLAVSFYGLSVLWHCADGRYASYTETYDVLFIILSFYLFLSVQNKGGYFISGLLAAIGLGFRLSAFFGIVALFITSLRKGVGYTLAFCGGLLAGITLLSLFFICAGIDMRQALTYTLADNFGSGSTTDHSFLWRMEQAFGMFFYSEMVLFYPLVLIYLFIKKRVDWLMLWLILEFIGINIVGNYARIQLKEILPALSLISALAVAHLVNIYDMPIRRVLLIIWICFFPKLLEPLVNFKKLFVNNPVKNQSYNHEPFTQPDEDGCKKLGLWIRANTQTQERVYVAGYGAAVQVYTERISPTIYFNATQTQIAKERFFNDMQLNKPEMILVPLFASYKQYIGADMRAYVDRFVAKYYYFDSCRYSYNIYRIKK